MHTVVAVVMVRMRISMFKDESWEGAQHGEDKQNREDEEENEDDRL
jgi:hypothetical protein